MLTCQYLLVRKHQYDPSSTHECLMDMLQHTILWPWTIAQLQTLSWPWSWPFAHCKSASCKVWPGSPAPAVCDFKIPEFALFFCSKSHLMLANCLQPCNPDQLVEKGIEKLQKSKSTLTSTEHLTANKFPLRMIGMIAWMKLSKVILVFVQLHIFVFRLELVSG